MTKQELIETIAEKTNMEKKTVATVVTNVFSEIEMHLIAGHKVSIVGFGTFDVKERAARKGRNPQTGEVIEIAATKAVTFKPSKNLKEAVKEG